MRLIAGENTEFDVIWRRCRPGARIFGTVYRVGSGIAVNNPEGNHAVGIGEVDEAGRISVPNKLSQYPGDCVTGDPSWFDQGIPPQVLNGPPPEQCCAVPSVAGLGLGARTVWAWSWRSKVSLGGRGLTGWRATTWSSNAFNCARVLGRVTTRSAWRSVLHNGSTLPPAWSPAVSWVRIVANVARPAAVWSTSSAARWRSVPGVMSWPGTRWPWPVYAAPLAQRQAIDASAVAGAAAGLGQLQQAFYPVGAPAELDQVQRFAASAAGGAGLDQVQHLDALAIAGEAAALSQRQHLDAGDVAGRAADLHQRQRLSALVQHRQPLHQRQQLGAIGPGPARLHQRQDLDAGVVRSTGAPLAARQHLDAAGRPGLVAPLAGRQHVAATAKRPAPLHQVLHVAATARPGFYAPLHCRQSVQASAVAGLAASLRQRQQPAAAAIAGTAAGLGQLQQLLAAAAGGAAELDQAQDLDAAAAWSAGLGQLQHLDATTVPSFLCDTAGYALFDHTYSGTHTGVDGNEVFRWPVVGGTTYRITGTTSIGDHTRFMLFTGTCAAWITQPTPDSDGCSTFTPDDTGDIFIQLQSGFSAYDYTINVGLGECP